MKALGRHWFPIALATLVVAVTMYIWQPWNDGTGGAFEDYGEAFDFTLENTDGRTVSLSEEDGKARLVYFFFSHCPDICLPTTAMLSKVQEELQDRGSFGDKSMIYSISFDPDRDTRERLTQVADGYGADPNGWLFLRGEEETIKQVTQAYHIMAVKDASGNFIHSNLFTLVDKDGRIRKIYNANDMEDVVSGRLVDGIAADMEKLAR